MDHQVMNHQTMDHQVMNHQVIESIKLWIIKIIKIIN